VNLEVVRSRAARGKGDIASVGRFAESASSELERAVALVQALLELARPLSSPVDLWSAMLPMVVLQNAIAGAAAASGSEAGSEGATAAVTLERRGDSPFVVAAPSTIARLAVASALEVAVGAATPAVVHCSIEMLRGDIVGDGEEEGSGQVVAVVLRCAAPLPSIDPATLECIEDGGVMLNIVSDGMRLDFRAAGRD
jgi:hypothetical protein